MHTNVYFARKKMKKIFLEKLEKTTIIYNRETKSENWAMLANTQKLVTIYFIYEILCN